MNASVDVITSRTPIAQERNRLRSERPAHAARAPTDQLVPRVPHNVACPVCHALVGSHCSGRAHNGGAASASHPERRVLAGKARRLVVYGTDNALVAGWRDGIALVLDSLADDPVWGAK